MTSHKVTWLMPVKNGMPYLTETLLSIKHQTYRNWEILVWDNGSNDGTAEELRKWIPGRIPGRIVSDKPLSLGRSLAALVDLASTELCARVDADDISHPNRLERQVSFLLARPEVGILGTQLKFIDVSGKHLDGAWIQPTSDAEIRWTLRWTTCLNHPTVLFRRSAILAAGNYREGRPFEDYDLWLRASMKTELANLPDVLVKYRLVPTSFTQGATLDPRPGFTSVAEMNSEILFGSFPSSLGLNLREKIAQEETADVSFRDLIHLRRAAGAAAAAIGKPAEYFISTELYKRQMYQLRDLWLEKTLWGRTARSLKRNADARLRSMHSSRE